jgi:LEA14-like dessication related protein
MIRLSPLRAGALAGLVVLAGCATVKPPTLQVEGLKIGKFGITGVAMDVHFRVRNPNPDPLFIERFEYELFMNGNRLGRGYEPDPVQIAGFREERVSSRFDLNLLSLPGTVKDLINDDRAHARAKGTFFVRQRDGGLKKLGFDADAQVDIKH